jgi:chromosome partitioning protein
MGRKTMKTLALLARKGGAGKTTLAIHLAVIAARAGKRVLLVDTDPQRSAAAWWRSRPADVPELVECDATKLAPVLAAAEEAGVDLVVVDSRPSVEADTGAVAKLADLVLIPTRPAILDLRAIAETVRVVTNAKKPALIVLNATPAARAGVREAAITAEARRALAAYDVPVASVAITSRADLSHALVGGLAVNEFAPNGKAAAELGELFKIVEKALWPKQRARR